LDWRRLSEKLNAMAACGNVREAEHVFHRIKDVVPKSHVRLIWNTMLKACANAGEHEHARKLFEEMRTVTRPNDKTFGKLIEAAAKAGKYDLADYWSQETVNHGFELNLVRFSSVIDAAAQVGDTNTAEFWRCKMIQSSVKPNLITYNTLLNAAAKRGDERSAERWLSMMIAACIEPNITSFQTLMKVSATNRDAVSARRRLDQIKQAGIAPKTYTFNIMIDLFSKLGRMGEAENCMDAMRKSLQVPDIRSYGSLVDGYAKIRKSENAWKKAVAWFGQMEGNRIKGTVVQYSQLLMAIGNAKPPRKVVMEALIKRMVRNSVKPNRVTLSILTRQLGRPWTLKMCSDVSLSYGAIMSDTSFDAKKQKRLLSPNPDSAAFLAHGRKTL